MKKQTLKFVAAVGVAVAVLFPSMAMSEITDGLVAYFPLDGDFNDVVGGHNGTFMGSDTAPNFSAGKFGDGIDLDGIDQFVEVADPDAFNFVGSDFSVAAWTRVDGFTKSWQALLANGEGNRWRFHRRGGESIITGNGGNADVPAYDPAALGLNALDDGELHHVALVSRNGDSVNLWVDGVNVSTGPAPTVEFTGMPVMIGENPDARNRTWDGLIDDVGLWNRALTDNEIGALQTQAIPEPSSAVLAILGMLSVMGIGRRFRR
ncbi:MAG: LamG domain-containing protein [Planctomycetales bacterium]|nr:LamG domain-containing protein [Planctomycetales bacterium]